MLVLKLYANIGPSLNCDILLDCNTRAKTGSTTGKQNTPAKHCTHTCAEQVPGQVFSLFCNNRSRLHMTSQHIQYVGPKISESKILVIRWFSTYLLTTLTYIRPKIEIRLNKTRMWRKKSRTTCQLTATLSDKQTVILNGRTALNGSRPVLIHWISYRAASSKWGHRRIVLPL